MRINQFIALFGLLGLMLLGSVQADSHKSSPADSDPMAPFMEVVKQFGSEMKNFDPQAGEVYLQLFKDIIRTRSAAEATVWKFKVEEGLTPEEVEASMKSVAN